MNQGSAPCYKCPDRQVGCHSECEKYRAYVKANEARRDADKASRQAREYFAEAKQKNYFYSVKHHPRRGGKSDD